MSEGGFFFKFHSFLTEFVVSSSIFASCSRAFILKALMLSTFRSSSCLGDDGFDPALISGGELLSEVVMLLGGGEVLKGPPGVPEAPPAAAAALIKF